MNTRKRRGRTRKASDASSSTQRRNTAWDFSRVFGRPVMHFTIIESHISFAYLQEPQYSLIDWLLFKDQWHAPGKEKDPTSMKLTKHLKKKAIHYILPVFHQKTLQNNSFRAEHLLNRLYNSDIIKLSRKMDRVLLVNGLQGGQIHVPAGVCICCA